MYFNGFAVSLPSDAISNCAVGSKALYANKTGSSNTANGFQALYSNVSGGSNTANGYQSLFLNTIGNNNVAVGYAALSSNVNGRNNTALGEGADVSAPGIDNASAIGSLAIVDNTNSMAFGNSRVTTWAFGRTRVNNGNALQVGFDATNGNGAFLTLGGTWTNTSDSTKKDGITKMDGAEILSKLKQLSITKWKYKGTSEYHIGPMAQDFYKLFNVGVDNISISSIDPAGIALIAIKEQQKQMEEADRKYKSMMKLIEKMQMEIDALKKKNKAITSKTPKMDKENMQAYYR
jgi:hypothetical protein